MGDGAPPRVESDKETVCISEDPVWWLFREPGFLRRRKKAAKAKAEAAKKTAEEEADKAKEKAAKTRGRLKVKVGRRSSEVSVPACDCCRGREKPAGEDGEKGGGTDGIAAGVWKVVGAAAAGITATGAIVAVGGAVLWIRFNEVGIPATQAVGVQPKGESLALGAQETIIFVAIALVAVLLVYFADPDGVIKWITLVVLGALVVGAAVYLIFGTHLSWYWKLGLIGLAMALLVGCVAVGYRTNTRFWPLALAVFVGSLVFSAATGVLIVKQQKFVQGVAILRGPGDAGLTGVYVAATDKTIYFAQNVATAADPKSRMAMLEVPREGATYAVGPLESRADAAKREAQMLEQLIANRERAGAAPEAAPKEPETDVGAEEEQEAKEGKKKAKAASTTAAPKKTGGKGKSSEVEGKTVAEAFGDGAEVTVHETVEEPWECLVRFASAGSGLLGKWWTSCEAVEELEAQPASMLKIRKDFALPSRFQLAYDMKVEAHLPKGGSVTYMTGAVAPQCEHAKPLPCGYRWPGGTIEQLYLPEPNLVEDPHRECTETRINAVPKWGECKEQG